MDIKKQYDVIGHSYLTEQQRYFIGRPDPVRDFILSCMGDVAGKKILDIGCGGGRDMQLYEKMGATVHGIDPSKTMVLEAKKHVQHPERVHVAEWEATSFGDDFFDIVVGRFSLHYLETFDKAYAEAHRILKRGGLLVIVVDHPLFPAEKRANYGKKEVITIPLYENKVSLSFPTHTFAEYLAPLAGRFYVERFLEGKEQSSEPDFLGIAMRRR